MYCQFVPCIGIVFNVWLFFLSYILKIIQFSFSASTDELPYLKCPLHTALKLTPMAYGEFCHFSMLLETHTVHMLTIMFLALFAT